MTGAGPCLTGVEVESLVAAAPLMAAENAMRMLTDHLDGDRYFKVEFPGHNLRRAGIQLAVARQLART